MTTVDAPVSHLRENPYEIAKSQLRKVAKTFAIDPNLVNVLQMCTQSNGLVQWPLSSHPCRAFPCIVHLSHSNLLTSLLSR